MSEPTNKHLEMVKLVFPTVGGLWLFYGVTLVGLVKQLQDADTLLDWTQPARIALWLAIVVFLVINLSAVAGAQKLLFDMAARAGVPLNDYKFGLQALVALHALIDVAAAVVAWLVLHVGG